MKLFKSKYKKAMAILLLGTLAFTQVSVYAYDSMCDDGENLYVPEVSNPSEECPEINWPKFPCPPFFPNIPDRPETPNNSGKPNTPDTPSHPEEPSIPEEPVKPEEQEVAHLPYIIGYEDGTFRAERAVTREEFATMVARLLLDGKSIDTISSFEDIKPNRYSNAYIGYLESLGIVQGYEDGTFRPFDSITTKEASAIIEKVQQIRNPKIRKATFFNGNETITRAEAVMTLNSVFERDCSDANIPNLFSDLQSDYWAYEDILFAAVEHGHVID